MARPSAKARVKTGTRAQACADFARKKARKKRRAWGKRSMVAVVVVLLSAVAAQDMWVPKVPSAVRLKEQANQGFWQLTADAGLALKQMYVHRRRYTSEEDVRAVLNMDAGTPILSLDLAALKQALEIIPEVRRAYIARQLPNDLHVVLDERVPVARWQHQGKQRLVDEEGVLLNAERYAHRMQLPVVVGANAPQQMQTLLGVLRGEPLLYANVSAAMHVGERRWNIRLGNGVTVMLPEENAAHAWKRFAQLVRDDAILTRAIDSIDLRMEDRVFITPIKEQKALPVLYRAGGKDA